MSKRQRFFVELIPDEITVISWKKLLADGESVSEPGSPATPTSNLHSPEDHALNSTGKVKRVIVTKPSAEGAGRERQGVNALEDRSNMNSTSRRKPISNATTITDAAVESDEEATIQTVVPKGKVHRSMPTIVPDTRAKTSCRMKKKIKACFCCSKNEGTT